MTKPFAFDTVSDDAAYWECAACGDGFYSRHSGFWCRHCKSVFKSPQWFSGKKQKLEVFGPGETMTFDLREKMNEYGRAMQASWENKSRSVVDPGGAFAG